MDINKMIVRVKEVLESIQNGEQVTRDQLEELISRIQDMISEIEEESPEAKFKESKAIDEDDLPI